MGVVIFGGICKSDRYSNNYPSVIRKIKDTTQICGQLLLGSQNVTLIIIFEGYCCRNITISAYKCSNNEMISAGIHYFSNKKGEMGKVPINEERKTSLLFFSIFLFTIYYTIVVNILYSILIITLIFHRNYLLLALQSSL